MSAPIYLRRDMEMIFSRDRCSKSDVLRSFDVSESFQLDMEEGQGWGPGKIAASATEVISMGPVTTARELFVVTDGEIDLIFNGANAVRVKPPKVPLGSTVKSGVLYMDTEFTSLSVENKETTETNVVIYMVGE